MGAFGPSPLIDACTRARIDETIVRPVLSGMAQDGTPFRGFLYVGLMITAGGPRVVEFNVRFGDPEAQVVIPSLTGALAPRLIEAAEGRLADEPLPAADSRHVGVVLASGGYPGPFTRGAIISGLDDVADDPGVLVFHSGTALRGRDLVTDGGRVLTVVGSGADFAEAMGRAYGAAGRIHFEGRHYRTDIGRKASDTEGSWAPSAS
jgi:phosphoribosylamine--glycine ligase